MRKKRNPATEAGVDGFAEAGFLRMNDGKGEDEDVEQPACDVHAPDSAPQQPQEAGD